MKRINLTKKTAAAFGLGVMLAMAPVAMAQAAPPPDPGTSGAGAPANSTANDPGSIDTSQQITTTTTAKTHGSSATNQAVGGDNDTKPLPNTGGDPLLFVLAGSMLIGGGWVLRRKMVQDES